MSDQRLREAERRALTGSVEEKAKALTARVRTAPGCERCGGRGLSSPPTSGPRKGRPDYAERCPACAGTGSPLRARVELAAYCREEAAHAALGLPPANLMLARTTPLDVMVRNLSRWADISPGGPCAPDCWGPNEAGERVHADGCRSFKPGWVLVRAAVAAARVALDVDAAQWSEISRWKQARHAIEAAETWLACPCEEHRIAAVRALLAADPTSGGLERGWLPVVPNRSGGGWGEETVGVWPSTADTAEWNRRAIGLAANLAGEQPVRDAIRSALVKFALGGEA